MRRRDNQRFDPRLEALELRQGDEAVVAPDPDPAHRNLEHVQRDDDRLGPEHGDGSGFARSQPPPLGPGVPEQRPPLGPDVVRGVRPPAHAARRPQPADLAEPRADDPTVRLLQAAPVPPLSEHPGQDQQLPHDDLLQRPGFSLRRRDQSPQHQGLLQGDNADVRQLVQLQLEQSRRQRQPRRDERVERFARFVAGKRGDSRERDAIVQIR
jgi:hypothetical protein